AIVGTRTPDAALDRDMEPSMTKNPSNESWRNTLDARRLRSRDEVERFVSLARELARLRGQLRRGYICGYIGVRAFVFEDELVSVSSAADNPSLEVVFKYPDGSITNPVVMVTETAEVIRVHGEHCYVVPHVEDAAVAAGLALDAGRCCSK